MSTVAERVDVEIVDELSRKKGRKFGFHRADPPPASLLPAVAEYVEAYEAQVGTWAELDGEVFDLAEQIDQARQADRQALRDVARTGPDALTGFDDTANFKATWARLDALVGQHRTADARCMDTRYAVTLAAQQKRDQIRADLERKRAELDALAAPLRAALAAVDANLKALAYAEHWAADPMGGYGGPRHLADLTHAKRLAQAAQE